MALDNNKFQDAFHVLKEGLSDAEIAQLEALNENSLLQEAIKKVLLFPIYYQGTLEKGRPAYPRVNWLLIGIQNALRDQKKLDELGSDLVAHYLALQLVESGVETLGRFKRAEPGKPKVNDAE